MGTIEPGTQVRVVIEGALVARPSTTWIELIAQGGYAQAFTAASADMQVVALDPERPTLNREKARTTIARLRAYAEAIEDHEGDSLGDDPQRFDEWIMLCDAADLIQAAHPEWTS